MIFDSPVPELNEAKHAFRAAYRVGESKSIKRLMKSATLSAKEKNRIFKFACQLVEYVRARQKKSGGLENLLHEYDLSTEEGVALMCLAEALLRVPDPMTADALIRDKIGGGDWQKHLGHSDSVFVNASTWALMLTGRVIRFDEGDELNVDNFLSKLLAKSSEPIIRQAMTQAMHIIGNQFVMGETISEALERASEEGSRNYRFSFDVLGEAARTEDAAAQYFAAYGEAIAAVGEGDKKRDLYDRNGISVKLSALHPRYEYSQRARVLAEMVPRLIELTGLARQNNISLCIDAEEASRLDLSLEIIEQVLSDQALEGWNGFGLAVQAYQKRAVDLIDWLEILAQRTGRRLMIRLVKGAYWDSEIKWSQVGGYVDYPVFTRKEHTDLSYLVCARKLLAAPQYFYPQFATHNAHTVASVIEYAGESRDFEFQRLHGMGQELYEGLLDEFGYGYQCRVYAPVGGHEDLLAYLVRRLLENGANTSFVNRLADNELPVERVIADPIEKIKSKHSALESAIPLPAKIYGDGWVNSGGLDLSDPFELSDLNDALSDLGPWQAGPIVGGSDVSSGSVIDVYNPADSSEIVGAVNSANPDQIDEAVQISLDAADDWDGVSATQRATILDQIADSYEQRREELIGLCIREAGKTIADAVAEIREAADFCRYYAYQARQNMAVPVEMPGPTGELNRVSLHGRGVFTCISPWNFPLAIFTGQIAAALVAGNAVIAKPAEQTPLIAALAVRIMHEAGVPANVLHLLPGAGNIGAKLVAHPEISGVAFTGSFQTARNINRVLADRDGAIAPLIAETGGINAMIVDSSSLPEQVADDVIESAFRSAGQRCSALRVLFIQDDVAPHLIHLLKGKADELQIGDPGLLSTDVGPIIDREAVDRLNSHASAMEREAQLIYRAPLPENCGTGNFFPSTIFKINEMKQLTGEVFGPVLHIIRYDADRIEKVIEAINSAGFGLTVGIHSRVSKFANDLHRRLKIGNTYVNRNMIGAVVGVQPFGGEGLSGTGPKAGGPNYLHRFSVERALSVNTAAVGGNADLFKA